MLPFRPFVMERWQSLHENRVEFNLSESGVHPLSLGELAELSGTRDLDRTLLGYGQSNGTDLLRSRIAALHGNCSHDSVVVTNGSAEANFITLWELVRPGDSVAIVVPTYMQTHGLAHSFGVNVKEIRLHRENGWQPDPDDVRDAIDHKTRVVIVTNPNNPTGAILGDVARRSIIAAAERVGAWILADEVYTGAELDGIPTASFFGQTERVISTGSLSKAYGLPGLRIGWAVAPPVIAGSLWAKKDYTTIGPGELTDRLATLALDPAVRDRILQRTRSYLREGLRVVEHWISRMDGFTYTPPRAGAIVFAHYDLAIDSTALAEALRRDYSVLIVPGDHFGMDHYIRLGIGTQSTLLEAGLARVESFVSKAHTLLL